MPAAVSVRTTDLVERAFVAAAPDRLWVADLERHEVLTNRAVMKEHRRLARRSALVKLGAARSQG